MQKIVLLFIGVFAFAEQVDAQRIDKQKLLIDMPTAGTLERGSYDLSLRMFGNGGLLSGVSVGITHRFMIGLSFGGENIIGQGKVDWNPQPGIQTRIRIMDENFAMPAITLGFDSQGFGHYDKELDRYTNKSRGLFAVASKNYAFLFNLGLHGGLNYSLEDKDEDKDLNLFIGAGLSLNREFRLVAEYDLASNDNENKIQFGSGHGFFNAGLQWSFSNQLFLQFNLKNILENGPHQIEREFKISYFEFF